MWRSSTKMQTLAPKWNESKEAPLSSRKGYLMHVVLFDWDKVGTDDFLGEVVLSLDEYLDGKRHTLQLELDILEGNQEKGAITGFVELEISSTRAAAR